MRVLFFIALFLTSIAVNAKTLFFGDSLTYVIGHEYKNRFPDTDIVFNVGFSFRVNHEFMFNTIDNTNLTQYDSIYIVFGTNDFINKSDIDNYSILTAIFINRILSNNSNINIVWILPPTLKNSKHNYLVSNTRESIKRSLTALGVKFFNVNDIFGNEFNYKLNNKQIRTNDGIHITNYGAGLIIDYLIKE
ncbi:hypothetical protein WMR86_20090 (plasmid) [Proteus vulgaris]|uniref:SGNH/GDSL hydrolase family protein n=1 Tax=Morganellaceae TaxID=1903414 RepID=UPI001315C32A|nr:hypothetical protein [Proteus mirabilis]QHA72598.1 hypothetical protein GO498_19660 [Proteus mirabilis]QKG51194.1 hypothetical protein HRD56_20435 [Proteus mirabilis]QNN35474.1 hypothetical protein H9X60_22175 [Providencia rettgeri]